jgi:[ribosomal protein S18]-alanine N-acetyltransferase
MEAKAVDITIRSVKNSDIASIIAIQTQANLSRWTRSDYEKEIDRNDSYMFVAEICVEIVGFIVARLTIVGDILQKNELEIYNIGVLQNKRNLKIGSKLLTIIQNNESLKPYIIWLEVRKSNKTAIKFYEKHNFIKVGERKNFFSNPVEDALLLKCEI